jgi:hypothetical protein
MIIIKAIAPKMPAKTYPKTGMKQETTVRTMQVIAAVVAGPRAFGLGDAGGKGANKGESVGDAGGKETFISLSEVPDPARLSKYFWKAPQSYLLGVRNASRFPPLRRRVTQAKARLKHLPANHANKGFRCFQQSCIDTLPFVLG